MKLNFISFAAAAAIFTGVAGLSSCGDPTFKIKGEIAGADNQSVLLEKSDFHGRWVVVDSVRTDSKGRFSLSRPAPASPEIFRLDFDGNFIYLPVDSIETVSVRTTTDGFGRDFTLSGSENAEALERFDKEVMALPSNVTSDSLDSFKRGVYSRYIHSTPSSIVSYYILTKAHNGKMLFDPQTADYKYFAAVANGFKHLRPSDPHTALLEQTTLNALKERNASEGRVREVEATEIKVLDIALPDEKGDVRRLSDVTGNGNPTVVIFSVLTHPDSPALNAALSQLYNQRAGSVNFYHISFDPDQYTWREAAANLPWTTVFEPDGEYSKALRDYNVGSLPVFFIYDRNGELKARAVTVDEIKKNL